jgi:hypothetical protein
MENSMSVTWNNKEYQPEKVVEKIASVRKKNGSLGWDRFEFAALLYSMLDFSNDIPEIDARGLVTRALLNSDAKAVITSKSIIAEINRLEREYSSLPVEKYVLVSSISINPSWVPKRIRLGSALVIFEKSLPTKFHKESETQLSLAQLTLFADRPTNYLRVRVCVSAKSIHHAAEQALETLDFIRGIWNWILNRSRPSRRIIFAGKPQPVNSVILGPLHTLHTPDGKLVPSDVWWYEPSYLGEVKLFTPNQNDIERINQAFNVVRKAFKKHKYPEVVHDAIIRYTRALDERDYTTAYLKLWSILELLTDTGKAGYDTTVKRTAFLFKEREYHLQILKHLKKYRNSSVHLDKENSEIETYLYQLKGYVETLIHFHINNEFGFETIQEAAEFLDLPSDEEVLRNQEKTFKQYVKKRHLARKFFGFK